MLAITSSDGRLSHYTKPTLLSGTQNVLKFKLLVAVMTSRPAITSNQFPVYVHTSTSIGLQLTSFTLQAFAAGDPGVNINIYDAVSRHLLLIALVTDQSLATRRPLVQQLHIKSLVPQFTPHSRLPRHPIHVVAYIINELLSTFRPLSEVLR